ncbi:MAG: hypothetical protein QW356_06355 [Candidatus Hadarchaeales archaeon]
MERLDELLKKFLQSDLTEEELFELHLLLEELSEDPEWRGLKSYSMDKIGYSLRDYNRLQARLSRLRRKPEKPESHAGRKVELEEHKYISEKITKDFETLRRMEGLLSEFAEDLRSEGKPFDQVFRDALHFYFENRDTIEELRMRVEQLEALVKTLADAFKPQFREMVEASLWANLMVTLTALKSQGFEVTPEALQELRWIKRLQAENEILKAFLKTFKGAEVG